MHVLVYERVLRYDNEFQLAHAYWIVQVPHVRRRSDAHANTYADTNANTNSDTDTYAYTDSNPDTCAGAKRTHEFSRESGIDHAGQLVVDGQLR